jgi:hypothetical protein
MAEARIHDRQWTLRAVAELNAAPELVREAVMEIPQTEDAFDCCGPFDTTIVATLMDQSTLPVLVLHWQEEAAHLADDVGYKTHHSRSCTRIVTTLYDSQSTTLRS